MFIRYLVALCLVALFAVAINADVTFEAEKLNDVEIVDRANPAAKAAAKMLGSIFAGAAASCLMEADNQCKSHWKNPGKALSCGKNFMKQNKGRCHTSCAAGR